MLCSVSTALLLLDREPAGPKLHKSSIYQQHFLAVDTPAYFVFRSSNFIYLFFYVKVHHTSPAKPLESTSPDNIQKSAHIGTFRKGGGDTKLTFVQPVQIVPYTQSHSVEQMSHCQTAQGDWRCGSHSDGDVRRAS